MLLVCSKSSCPSSILYRMDVPKILPTRSIYHLLFWRCPCVASAKASISEKVNFIFTRHHTHAAYHHLLLIFGIDVKIFKEKLHPYWESDGHCRTFVFNFEHGSYWSYQQFERGWEDQQDHLSSNVLKCVFFCMLCWMPLSLEALCKYNNKYSSAERGRWQIYYKEYLSPASCWILPSSIASFHVWHLE